MTLTRIRIAAAVMIAVVAAIYLLRLDHTAGLMVDDAWYMVLGKSLAGGDGFRLISSSATPIVPAVPPGFPALLAIVFLIAPEFPANVLLLKGVSLIGMAGVAAASWIYFTRDRGVPRDIAICMVAVVVLTPAFVFLATSTVMAEAMFTAAQIVTVIAVERTTRRESSDVRAPAAAGIAAALTILMRAAGVAVVAASMAHFLIHRRWRQASVFAAMTLVPLLPWLIYTQVNTPTFEQRVENSGTIAYSYEQLLAMERPGDATRWMTPAAMARRAARNLEDVLTRDLGAVFLPEFYRGPDESGEETISVGRPGRGSMGSALGTRVVSAVIGVLVIAGIIRTRAWFSVAALLIGATLAMIMPVGAQTFRYVVPLAPFLLLFAWRGIANPLAARIVVLCVLGFHLIDHGHYIALKANAAPSWIAGAGEIDEVLVWMNENLEDPGFVASSNPALVYLRTGRKGVVNAYPAKNWEMWRRSGVRYVVAIRVVDLPPSHLNGRLRFQTKGRLWIVEM